AAGFFVNNSPNVGPGFSIYKITLATHAIATFSSNVVFKDLYVAGNNRMFAWSPQLTTLYDVNPATVQATVSTVSSTLSASSVVGVAISTELPSARYLFLEVASGQQVSLNRVDLSRNAVDITGSSQQGVVPLLYVGVPALSGAGTFILYNNPQTIT